ncbi:MAG: acyl--CoA ligase [Elusimicrobia bacterium]|nr:MAG: acyl--CoA ligase [Elusimicrobiota bacterium]
MDWLDAQAALHPEKIALFDDEGNSLSYGGLVRLARRAAGTLRDLGLRRGDRVALLSYNRMETLAALFAARAHGWTLCPLNWRLTPSELSRIFEDFRPTVILHDAAHAAAAHSLCRGVPLSLSALAQGEAIAGGVPDPEATPLVLYTSGTTGRPKGALLSNRMIDANARQTVIGWGLRPDDTTVSGAPLFHTGGWNVLTLPLLSLGGMVHLHSKFDPSRVAALLRTGQVTVVFGVPTMFAALLEEDLQGACPRFLISGGAPCPAPLAQAYRKRGLIFKQGFGMTEVGPNCFYFPESQAGSKSSSVGLPMPGTEMKLVDKSGNNADSGELLIRGPHVFSGYLGGAGAEDWVSTGDLAERDADGYYYILGRLKEMFISGGENVYPAEVETSLLNHPEVSEAAVVGVPDTRWGEVGTAFLVARKRSISARALKEFLEGNLARYKIPKRFHWVESLPKNAMGKILKSTLRET